MIELQALVAAMGATLVVFVIAWAITATISDLTPLDSFWGLAPVAAVWTGALWDGALTTSEKLAAALTSIWGLRLAAYLIARWRRHGAEDPRYASMRRKAGPGFRLRSLWSVIGLQAALSLVVCLPIWASLLHDGEEPTTFGWGLAAIALLGVIIETAADSHLAAFKADPANAGKTLTTGLWALSRHPNYVGEILFWAAFAALAATYGAWWTLISPLVIGFLLARWSGAPLVERRMMRTRSDYADYSAQTGFLPFLRPKRPLTAKKD
jgi:steroid 5-alpha reductase family enzyme